MRASLPSLPVLVALGALACGGPARTGTRPDSPIGSDPVSHVEISVSGLSKSDAEVFRAQLLSQGGIDNVVLKSFASGTATYELDLRGCECELPSKISRIPSPGFRYQGRTTRLQYAAYDNLPPQITFVHPENEEQHLLDADLVVMVEVRDSDLAEVKVNGMLGEHYRGDVWLARLRLHEGKNELVAEARDKAGNQAQPARRIVYLEAADVAAAVRVLVEGHEPVGNKVLVEQTEVPVDSRGRYRAEILVKKGQRQVTIIAIDPNGKKSVTVKDIGE